MFRLKFVVAFIAMVIPSCIGSGPLPPPPDIAFVGSRTLLDRITIEIVPIKGFRTERAEIAALTSNLSAYLICPSKGVAVHYRDPVENPRRSWTYSDVLDFEQQHRTIWDHDRYDRHLKLFVSCLPGNYFEDKMTSIAGLAYGRQNSIALFQHYFERAMLLHEIGHVIGLVNRFNRISDPVKSDRPNHCNNKACVMFWQVRSNAVFDKKCIRDILNMIYRGVAGEYIRCTNRDCAKVPVHSHRPR